MWLNKREPADCELLFQSRIYNMTTKDIIPRKTKCAVSYIGRLTVHTKPAVDARNKDRSVRTENGKIKCSINLASGVNKGLTAISWKIPIGKQYNRFYGRLWHRSTLSNSANLTNTGQIPENFHLSKVYRIWRKSTHIDHLPAFNQRCGKPRFKTTQ